MIRIRESVPLYHQLKNYLLANIQSGTWASGEKLPSEAELANQFGMSRTTVRQAIGDLVSSGYLTRRQGQGTFVAKRLPTKAASPLYGFGEELRQRDPGIEVTIQTVQMTPCPPEIASELSVPENTPILLVHRVAKELDKPVFYETSYLIPPSTVLSVQQDASQFRYIYRFFEQHGVKIALGRQTIAAESATDRDAFELHVPLGSPVLVVRRITQEQSGTAVEYSEVRYAASLYQFEVNLMREGASYEA